MRNNNIGVDDPMKSCCITLKQMNLQIRIFHLNKQNKVQYQLFVVNHRMSELFLHISISLRSQLSLFKHCFDNAGNQTRKLPPQF